MNKLKSFIAALLSVGVMVSAAALTACSDNEKNSDSGATLTAGEQVASETEWRQAFENLINADSYSLKADYYDERKANGLTGKMSVKNKYYFDYANGLCLKNCDERIESGTQMLSAVSTSYYEVRNTTAWEWYSENDNSEVRQICSGATFEHIKTQMFDDYIFEYDTVCLDTFNWLILEDFQKEEGGTNQQPLSDLFSEFTYLGGVYSSNLISSNGMICKMKISIKGGNIIGLYLESASPENNPLGLDFTATFTVNISNINSTMVTAPAGAIEAIDAEEAETNAAN